MNKKRAIINNVMYVFLCVAISIAVGTLLMILVYCLPTNRIKENILHSVYIYSTENDSYDWATNKAGARLDNFTDALMMNIASYQGSGNAVKDAMNNTYVSYPGKTQTASLFTAGIFGYMDGSVLVDYSRYWHGYLVWLKPAMMVMNKGDIRILNMYLQFFLTAIVLMELYKKQRYKIVIPFSMAILTINPVSTVMCMQYSSIYLITMVAALILIKMNLYNSEKYWHLFLWIGISTAFFDFLTYPIVGLGINLILLIILGSKDLRRNMLEIVISSFAWGIGYAGMWAGKWIVASILTGENVIGKAIEMVAYRSFGDSTEEAFVDSSSAFNVVLYNLDQALKTPAVWVVAVFLVIILFMILFGKMDIKVNKPVIIALAVIAIFPIGWYCIIKNHSAIHSWMTYRNLSITVFSLALMLSYSIVPKKKKGERQDG